MSLSCFSLGKPDVSCQVTCLTLLLLLLPSWLRAAQPGGCTGGWGASKASGEIRPFHPQFPVVQEGRQGAKDVVN